MHHLAKRVMAHYAGSERQRDWPVAQPSWHYPECGELREPDMEAVMKEINGFDDRDGHPVGSFDEFHNDGSTACGSWIYSGIYKDGVNQARDATPAMSGPGRGRFTGVGVGLAREPADPLQPRQRGSAGQTLV